MLTLVVNVLQNSGKVGSTGGGVIQSMDEDFHHHNKTEGHDSNRQDTVVHPVARRLLLVVGQVPIPNVGGFVDKEVFFTMLVNVGVVAVDVLSKWMHCENSSSQLLAA